MLHCQVLKNFAREAELSDADAKTICEACAMASHAVDIQYEAEQEFLTSAAQSKKVADAKAATAECQVLVKDALVKGLMQFFTDGLSCAHQKIGTVPEEHNDEVGAMLAKFEWDYANEMKRRDSVCLCLCLFCWFVVFASELF